VEQILIQSGSVEGVRLDGGEELRAGAVLATCDPKQTLTRLLPRGVLPEPLARCAAQIPTSTVEAATLRSTSPSLAVSTSRATMPGARTDST
jgi:phytoene dehydrogenase-like protein